MSPFPKRDDQRRNTITRKADKVVVNGGVKVRQPAARKHWRDEVKAWYRSISRSGEAEYYEPSDWQMALAAGDMYDEWFKTKRATTFGEFRMLAHELMLTEGARLSSRVEVHRKKDESQEDKGQAAVVEYKARLGVVK